MGIRRVVTGHSPDGKAIVAGDEVVEPIKLALLPGFEFFRLWGADAPPQFPMTVRCRLLTRTFPQSVVSASGCSPSRLRPT